MDQEDYDDFVARILAMIKTTCSQEQSLWQRRVDGNLVKKLCWTDEISFGKVEYFLHTHFQVHKFGCQTTLKRPPPITS